MLKVKQFVLGPMGSNCYIIFDDQTKDAVIVDPGMVTDDFINFINENDLKLNKILLTHGHYDHIGGLGHIMEQTGAPVYIPEGDEEMLISPQKNLSGFVGGPRFEFKEADTILHDGDKIEISPGEELEVILTPGHTPGSACFLSKDFVVTGDTLFEGSIGRTDFPGSSPEDMKKSLKRLMEIDDNVLVLPGHGAITSIGNEKAQNIFIRNPNIIDEI